MQQNRHPVSTNQTRLQHRRRHTQHRESQTGPFRTTSPAISGTALQFKPVKFSAESMMLLSGSSSLIFIVDTNFILSQPHEGIPSYNGSFLHHFNTGEATFDLRLVMRHEQDAAMPGESPLPPSSKALVGSSSKMTGGHQYPRYGNKPNYVHAVDRWDHRLSECGSVCWPRCFIRCGTERQQHRHVIPSVSRCSTNMFTAGAMSVQDSRPPRTQKQTHEPENIAHD